MLEAERHRVITKLVAERSVVGVAELVWILGASEATIRRDVNSLAEQGLVRRIRGGVESLQPRHEAHLAGVPFVLSQGIAVAEKRAIARAAAALINDGDNIIIAGGTTTSALAEFLLDRELDILTNSIPVFTQLYSSSRNRLMLPGGTAYREQNIVLSPYQTDTIENFVAQKLFMGCYGLSRAGVMETDPLIVHAQGKLLRRADQLIVMADSRKLRQKSSMVIAPLERVATVITDDGATEAELEPIRTTGIQVIVAERGPAAPV